MPAVTYYELRLLFPYRQKYIYEDASSRLVTDAERKRMGLESVYKPPLPPATLSNARGAVPAPLQNRAQPMEQEPQQVVSPESGWHF
jgi:hypothetical protein